MITKILYAIFIILLFVWMEIPRIIGVLWESKWLRTKMIEKVLPQNVAILDREKYICGDKPIHISVRYSGDTQKFSYFNGISQKAYITPISCGICNRYIRRMERLIYHQTGYICYLCYSKDLQKRNIFLTYFLSQFTPLAEVKELRLIIMNLYIQLRKEKLVMFVDDKGISKYNDFFMCFPSLPIPSWRNHISGEMLIWHSYRKNKVTPDIHLHKDLTEAGQFNYSEHDKYTRRLSANRRVFPSFESALSYIRERLENFEGSDEMVS